MHEHKCTHDGCNHAVVNAAEMKRLKNNGYGKDSGDKSWKTYVIKNKNTGKIAELTAASSLHASKLIGWRPRHTVVLETRESSEE